MYSSRETNCKANRWGFSGGSDRNPCGHQKMGKRMVTCKLMNGSGRRTNKIKTKRNQRSSNGWCQCGNQPINQAPTPARQTNTHPTSTLHMVYFLCFSFSIFATKSSPAGKMLAPPISPLLMLTMLKKRAAPGRHRRQRQRGSLLLLSCHGQTHQKEKHGNHREDLSTVTESKR